MTKTKIAIGIGIISIGIGYYIYKKKQGSTKSKNADGCNACGQNNTNLVTRPTGATASAFTKQQLPAATSPITGGYPLSPDNSQYLHKL